MTVEDAVERSRTLLGEDESIPNFYNELEKSLSDIPTHPIEQQLALDIHTDEMEPSEIVFQGQLKLLVPSNQMKNIIVLLYGETLE